MGGILHSDRIFVAGHKGLVGSALVKNLKSKGYTNLVTADRKELDLRNTDQVYKFIANSKIDAVIVAAAKVGGIHANNSYRADFIYDNLQIQTNLIWGAHLASVKNLCFLGSSCIYPRLAPQPMPEECLLTSSLEYTNRPYAIAKIAGLELVNTIRQQYKRNYFSVMPTNLYGPEDNFHPENAHVLPALMLRFWEAKINKQPEVKIWGSGKPKREFMYVDDCADAIIYLMEKINMDSFSQTNLSKESWSHVNVGSGVEVSILELAKMLANAIGYDGKIELDSSKPDGTPRKLLDIQLLNKLGWKPRIHLEEGLKRTVEWFVEKYKNQPEAIRR